MEKYIQCRYTVPRLRLPDAHCMGRTAKTANSGLDLGRHPFRPSLLCLLPLSTYTAGVSVLIRKGLVWVRIFIPTEHSRSQRFAVDHLLISSRPSAHKHEMLFSFASRVDGKMTELPSHTAPPESPTNGLINSPNASYTHVSLTERLHNIQILLPLASARNNTNACTSELELK